MPSPKWKLVFSHKGTTLSTPVPKKNAKRVDARTKIVAPSGNAYVLKKGQGPEVVAPKDRDDVAAALLQYNIGETLLKF